MREELRVLESSQDRRYEQSRSVNAASLCLEKSYRELCRRHKIDDILGFTSGSERDLEFKPFDPTQYKPSIRKKEDNRMRSPIWRGMYG